MQSENINELATALAKAQKEIRGAIKDSSNPFFKSKYADLASVWESIREPLTNNGLSVVQALDAKEGKQYLNTMLLHSSGQWISSSIELMFPKIDAQTIGSCISYMRRYSLSAMVGVPQIDDDGEAATQPTRPQQQPKNIEPTIPQQAQPTQQTFANKPVQQNKAVMRVSSAIQQA